ncbi:unnamed protein product, partial [Rotaria socialis]
RPYTVSLQRLGGPSPLPTAPAQQPKSLLLKKIF